MSMTTKAGLKIYSRSDWGARPARSTAPLGPIRRACVHHGGPVGKPRMNKASAVQTCQVWQNFHMDSPDHGWVDIGYHFLGDGLGRLYQGRPTDALGAHVLGQNTGCIGVNFMQDGRYYGLTGAQKRTLKTLFTAGIPELDVPPLRSLVRNPAADHYVNVHRRFPGQSTDCPGDLIERDFDVILKENQ